MSEEKKYSEEELEQMADALLADDAKAPKEEHKPKKKSAKKKEKEPVKKPMFNFKPTEKSQIMEKSVDEEAQELNLDPLVIRFMDADLASEKNDILSKLRPIITNDMIDILAMSVGVVINEGDVYDRYNDLRTCLTTMEKFESTRLRS